MKRYFKEFSNSLEEILANHNYAIFIEDENLLKKVFSVVEEIHEKIHLKHFAITLIKIHVEIDENEFIIIECVKSLYRTINFSYFFSFKGLEERVNFVYAITHFNLSELNKEERKHIKNDIGIIKEILQANDIREFWEITNVIKFAVPISASAMKFFV